MSRPADLPFADHFQEMACGSRAKYVNAHCRCRKCRAANCRYVQQRDALAKDAARELAEEVERSRRTWAREKFSLNAVAGPIREIPGVQFPCKQLWTAPDGRKRTRVYKRACAGVDGEPCRYGSHLRKDSTGDLCARCRVRLVWNGLVPADDVRRHLKKLSRQGVGYKSVAVAADVSKTTLEKILAGTKHRLRAQSARRVLAIDRDAKADHALVPAAPTWRRLNHLLSEGFTKTELARRLGSRARTPSLQFKGRYILARTVARVERFYRIVMAA